MATWPVSLPQSPQRNGYQRKGPNNVLRSPMDAGPAKLRRRMTAATKPNPMEILLTRAQLATFVSFHQSTLGDGSLPFEWIDHLTGDPCTYAFTGDYEVTARGYDSFLVRLPLEIRP